MHNRMIVFAAALALASASGAAAQQDTPQAASQPPRGSVDIGARYTNVTGDEARFERFRDLGNGAFLEGLRFVRQGADWIFNGAADHVGRRDQRYTAEFRSPGKVKVFFQWDQIPLFNSSATRTPYAVQSPGVLRLSDPLRQGIQAGTMNLTNAAALADPFDIRSRRDTATFSLVYSASRDIDLKVDLKTARRQGTQQYGAIFGMSNAVEVPAPIDSRTTDLNARLEYANQRGSVMVGYLGSWFDNHVPTLVWDDPWRFSDAAGNFPGSQGQMALPPSNDTQGITASAALKLPARSRATGNVTFSNWSQNQALLPFTINTVVPITPLPRATAEGSARATAMNYTFTSRPSKYVWLNARYRYYDFDNRTPSFDAGEGFVLVDQGRLSTDGDMTHRIGSKTNHADIDASFTPIPFTALRVGYTRENVDRTDQLFGHTAENVVRASVDTVSTGRITVRGIVEHSSRTGSDFDAEHVGANLPETRYYYLADRNRNRFTGLVQLTPTSILGLSASVATGKDDYNQTGLGLRDNSNHAYTFAADVAATDQVVAGIAYAFEKYTALQTTRVVTSTTKGDPTRNVDDRSADRNHVVTASLDLLKMIPRTDLRFGYNFSRSRATYVWSLYANSPLAAPVQLPAVVNEQQLGTADVRYFVTPKVAIGFTYWHDQYRVSDFALDPGVVGNLSIPTANATTGAITYPMLLMGYDYRPYTANSGWIRLTYLW